MASEDKTKPTTNNTNTNTNTNTKGKKRKYLPHGKPVRKGSYPLRPGVQGFFLTCDGGREHQATREALSLLDAFYEELVLGKELDEKPKSISHKPLNKIIKFKDSDSSSDEDEGPSGEELDDGKSAEKDKVVPPEKQQQEASTISKQECEKHGEVSEEAKSKKQRLEDHPPSEHTEPKQSNDKPIDELIDDELKELGDRKKRLFVSLDSGCNGVIFIQMHKRAGDPGPVDIVQHMMSSAASTRKHMSRFILRVLPIEVTCYASEEEITKAIKPLVEQYFPKESASALKFAVLYEARSNTGVDRMKIINAVAKSVPQPHKVDLNNPDKTIIVQIAKTICLIGVVERYKELLKYNLRQLTSPQK